VKHDRFIPVRISPYVNAVIGLVVACVFIFTSCFKESFDTSGSAQLAFSTDTLRFDTVFTELGSATRSLRVYNNSDLAVRVSRVTLDQSPSRYRINVDGFTGPDVQGVEIKGKDSIWVFVEVTINPDNPLSISPFVSEDYLVFETNGNTQKVLLEAWGQNANYIPSRFDGNQISVLTCDLETQLWDDPRPYVIYGTLLIDSCNLVLPAGTRLYVHGGIADNILGVYNDGLIYTLPHARLITQGTTEDPVIIQDDRLESDYTGLWSGIQFGPGSGPHQLSNTIIRHAATAVVADSASRLNMENCIIHSNAGSALYAIHAQVHAVNCLFYDNAGTGVALTYGGNYTFDYCTMTSYGNDGEAIALTNFTCPDPLCQEGIFVNAINATVRNSVIVGSSSDEILLSDAAPGQGVFDVSLRNCIVRVRDLLDVDAYPDFFTTLCQNCIEYAFGDTLFKDQSAFDFHLDTLSLAEEKAIPLFGATMDLDGRDRDATAPDIGCYEYYPE